MTAEVAVMNKNAIALAADSAATLEGYSDAYNHHGKLFSLTKHHPVSIMIYNRLQLNGVPWETIIKLYQQQLGRTSFAKIDDYRNDLIDFINNHQRLFPKTDRDLFIQRDIMHYLQQLTHEIQNIWHNHQQTNQMYGDLPLSQFSNLYITNQLKRIKSENSKHPEKSKQRKYLQKIVKNIPNDVFQQKFTAHTLKPKDIKTLRELISELLFGNNFDLGSSGIVIAGFGEDEYFPAVSNLITNGFYGDELNIHAEPVQKITHTNQGQIIPFAQTEMISSFIKGIHPEYENFLLQELLYMLCNLPGEIIKPIQSLTEDEKAKYLLKGQRIALQEFQRLRQDITGHIMQTHIQPIIDTIKHLPKSSLAEVAESLVQITSFKQTVSPGDKSVDSNIDVLLITKGDGVMRYKKDNPSETQSLLKQFTQ